jgi:hypothetical protein
VSNVAKGNGSGGYVKGLVRRFDAAELDRSVDALYDVFGAYPLRTKIDACPHCELDAAERQLHVRPLRDMTWADLGTYSFKALTSFGDQDDLRHFLPRVLELYACDHAGAPHALMMFCGKLDLAAWTTWPAEEVAALRRFFDAWTLVVTARAGESEEGAWELDELKGGITAL